MKGDGETRGMRVDTQGREVTEMPGNQRRIDGAAAVGAGLAAGGVFMAMMMLAAPWVVGGGVWMPVRMTAAVVAGPGVLTGPGPSVVGVAAAALVAHFSFSIFYAVLLGWVVHAWRPGVAVAAGAAFGAALYVINFHYFAEAFVWFATARSGIVFAIHVLFGATAALAYQALATRNARPAPAAPRPDRP